ncbi:hypothetical protein MSUIS_05920 [Mycoplasma suis KI3806]|uniref:Uncharacterized protein n=1 Tax=Mycoplasma suis (strain KI_3806) TaxID=708248 RepID=F0V204_MYCS3|nr:hypothetical protein [Mycoplasma suis]CBZ40685.1 hypothetical protein MSUIS_05920 [Mycoplasma suis KI3806]
MGLPRGKTLLLFSPLLGAGGLVFSNGISENNFSGTSEKLLGNRIASLFTDLFSSSGKQSNSFLSFSDNKVERKESETKVSDFSTNKELNIQTEDSLNQLVFEEVNLENKQSSSSVFVNGLFSEIQKEKGVTGIDNEMIKKISKSNGTLSNHLESFKKSYKNVKGWADSMKTVKEVLNKLKNSETQDFSKLKTEETSNIEKNEKKSILSFYEQFLQLQKERKNLNDQLIKVSSLEGKAIEEQNKGQKLLEFLKKINWGDSEITTKVEQLKQGEGNLEEKPYTYFMDEEEWKIFEESHSNIQTSIKEQKENVWIKFCSLVFMPFFYSCGSDTTQLENNKLMVEKFLDLKISSKLLFEMQMIKEEVKLSSFLKTQTQTK